MHSLSKRVFRTDQFPFTWCPGCGNGTVAHAVGIAVEELGILDRVCTVGGVGCSGWIGSILRCDFFKAIHGRGVPNAIGLKMTDRTRKVMFFSGDGDCAAIGGNHFLHGCHKNVDITVVMINNQIYGMTGGQAAPTTPVGSTTPTSPYGKIEAALDLCKVAEAAGATFVSRWSTAHPVQLSRSIKRAIMHPGFSYVEVITQCPTQSGRYVHGSGDPNVLLDWIRQTCRTKSQMEKLSPGERAGKILIGDLLEEIRPELASVTYQLMADLQKKAAAQGQGGAV